MKSLFQARTFWLAVLQGVLGVAVVVATQYNEAGLAVILKSLVDISLRLDTRDAIE